MAVQIGPLVGEILGECGENCKVYRTFAVSCAKTAEQIDLPFGLWIPVVITRVSTSSIVFRM